MSDIEEVEPEHDQSAMAWHISGWDIMAIGVNTIGAISYALHVGSCHLATEFLAAANQGRADRIAREHQAEAARMAADLRLLMSTEQPS